jgi:hypothetical protein
MTGIVPDQVRGRLVGRAHVSGTLAAPRIDADAAPSRPPSVRPATTTCERGSPPALDDDCTVDAGETRLLVVDGAAPVQLALSPWHVALGDVTARVRADGVDVGFIAALWPRLFTRSAGRSAVT